MAKQKRRGHGEGSIYQRKDGRWVAEITLDDGKRKMFYGKTRREASEKLDKARIEQKQGMLATGPQQKLKDYLEQWLEDVHKPTLRVGSYLRYRTILNQHLVPTLGHVQLQKLAPQQVQTLYTRKRQEGLAPRTIRAIHMVLHKALDNAVRWKLIAKNVCDDVSLPRETRHEIQPLTKEQAQKLLDAARGHRLEGLLTLAVATGMRRGELLGLKWRDVSLENGSLYIRHSVNRFEGHGFVENDPKTPTSRRRVLLPQFVVEALKNHRTRQLEARLDAGAAWQDHDLVFCNSYGNFFDPASLRRLFKTLLKDAGLPDLRFHDLRHSAATILLGMGTHPKLVQELLGHSNISITMDTYSHVLPSMQKDMMERLDDLYDEQL